MKVFELRNNVISGFTWRESWSYHKFKFLCWILLEMTPTVVDLYTAEAETLLRGGGKEDRSRVSNATWRHCCCQFLSKSILFQPVIYRRKKTSTPRASLPLWENFVVVAVLLDSERRCIRNGMTRRWFAIRAVNPWLSWHDVLKTPHYRDFVILLQLFIPCTYICIHQICICNNFSIPVFNVRARARMRFIVSRRCGTLKKKVLYYTEKRV